MNSEHSPPPLVVAHGHRLHVRVPHAIDGREAHEPQFATLDFAQQLFQKWKQLYYKGDFTREVAFGRSEPAWVGGNMVKHILPIQAVTILNQISSTTLSPWN